MKRLMCLSLLLLLGVGIFSTRASAVSINIFDLGGAAADGLGNAANDGAANGPAGGNKYGDAALGSVVWAANQDATIATDTIIGTPTDATVAIGSSAASSSTVVSYGNLVTDPASGATWVNLLIGGISQNYAGGLNDFKKTVSGSVTSPGQIFSASFGRIVSLEGGAAQALQVLVGNKAEYIKITDLTAKTAAVQGDLATGNALELTKLTLVGSGSGVSSKAIDGNSTLTLGAVVPTGTAGDDVGFAVESSGANLGKIVFSDDFTFGRNEETITFVSDSGAGDARAEIVANKSLTLDSFGAVANSAGVKFVTTGGKGKISVGEDLTINLAGAATLANVDVLASGVGIFPRNSRKVNSQ